MCVHQLTVTRPYSVSSAGLSCWSFAGRPPIGTHMSSKTEVVRSTALVLLPLAAFLVGPALDEVAAESIPDEILLSWMPTLLPVVALVAVGVADYRRTHSAAHGDG